MARESEEFWLWEALGDQIAIYEFLRSLANELDRPMIEVIDDLNDTFSTLREHLPVRFLVSKHPNGDGEVISWRKFAPDDIFNEKDELAGPPYYWFTLYGTGVTSEEIATYLLDSGS